MSAGPAMVGLTVQFHPDWPTRDGERVIEALARDGVYRSQFETGTSAGGLTAHPGGDRWRWESRLFAGRYDAGPAGDRPVYGAWNRHGDPYGGAIRFGSAHLRLTPAAAARSTYCWPDSVFDPTEHGGPEVLDRLCALADEHRSEAGADPLDDYLDDYVEAHLHGGLILARDVSALVLDPCFRDGPVHEAAARLGCAVEWHPGLAVTTAGLDPGYRGPAAVALAGTLGERLTPATVGDAARTGAADPQELKRVWHLLAGFGREDNGERDTGLV